MLQQAPTVIVQAAPPSAHPYFDVIVPMLPTLIAVAAGLWAVYKYLRDRQDTLRNERALREKEIETAKTESQKPFSAKQQEVFFDLLGTTSRIANSADPYNDPLRKEVIQHFWVLFWGCLPLVADKDVAIAADAFSVALEKPMDMAPLRNASMDLARACRKALGEAWSLGLEQFDKSDAAIAKEIPPAEEFYPDAGRDLR